MREVYAGKSKIKDWLLKSFDLVSFSVDDVTSQSAARSLLRAPITWKMYLSPQLKRTHASVLHLPRRRLTYLNLYFVLGGTQRADLWRWLVPYLSLTFKQSRAVSPPTFMQQPIPYIFKSELLHLLSSQSQPKQLIIAQELTDV